MMNVHSAETLSSKMKILFVDDMPDTRNVFKLAFGLRGHHTRTAVNGVEAVNAVREEPFDAIVMDVEMPQLNGWDAVKQIRTLPHGNGVPIIMFTAYSNSDDELHAHQVGADVLLQKPLLPQELLAQISKLISRRADSHA